MAQFYDNFENETVGQLPTGWQTPTNQPTTDWKIVDIGGTKFLQNDNSDATPGEDDLLEFLGFSNESIIEVYGVARTSIDNSSSIMFELRFGGLNSSTLLDYEAYRFDIKVSQDVLRIRMILNGASTELGTIPYVSAPNTLIAFRVKVENNVISMKAWDSTQAEPGSYLGTITDGASNIASGGFAISMYSERPTVEWREVGIGTAGDPAPTTTVIQSIETFQDDFPGSTLNTDLWVETVQGDVITSIANNTVTLDIPSTGSGQTRLSYIGSKDFYSIEDNYFAMELVQYVQYSGTVFQALRIADTTDNFAENGYIFSLTDNGTLNFIYLSNGTFFNISSIPYDPSEHRYLRFRHSSVGSLYYFETSSDNINWVTREEASDTYLSPSAVRPVFNVFIQQNTTIISDPVWANAGIREGENITTSFKAVIKTHHVGGSNYRLVHSVNSDLSAPTFTDPDSVGSNIITGSLRSLPSDTRIYYGLEDNGSILAGERGDFRTPPGNSKFSFDFFAASCANNNRGYEIFPLIAQEDPLFFMHLGDIHYQDIESTDPNTYLSAFETPLEDVNQKQLFNSMPVWYIWDDHDFGPNNSDKTHLGRDAAVEAFRKRVPITNFPLSGITDAVYYTFDVGRIRFVVTDLRSQRDEAAKVDGVDKTMMGLNQRQWITNIFQNSSNKVICWINSVPWITQNNANDASDNWSTYATERQIIADVIEAEGLQNRMFMLSGDMHALAIDDGTNSDYSTAQSGGFPVFHCAPLDNSNSIKGGPYSEGVYNLNQQQVGKISVTDPGGSLITITLTGYENNSGTLNSLVSHQFQITI